MLKDVLAQEVVRELMSYNRESGMLIWRPRRRSYFPSDGAWRGWNARYAAMPAFTTVNGAGYLKGSILSRHYLAHRVAWAIETGLWPENDIDHVNGDRTDNRFSNLRDVTNQENCQNQRRAKRNTSGVLGVSWHLATKKWQASIRVNGACVYLGLFDDIEAAARARSAASAAFGYHQNHGRAA